MAWCTVHAEDGIHIIPTPNPYPIGKLNAINLVEDLSYPNLQIKTLQKLETLAVENERNRVQMVEAGLANALVSFLVSCYRKGEINGVEECLSLFYLVRCSLICQSEGTLIEDDEIFDSLMWILVNDRCFRDNAVVKSYAAYTLEVIVQKCDQGMLERLKPELFTIMMSYLNDFSTIFPQGTNSFLRVLLDTCPWIRNRVMMIESGAVFNLIELELRGPEKKTTELVFGILYRLCSCADGRAQLLNHIAGIAVVTRQILKVSSTVDDRAVSIIGMICKYSGTDFVRGEMLRVGTVSKLCMVMQMMNCASCLKEKVRGILRMHFDVWKDLS
ncbi:hypothetical protein RD792_014296 [Penstemon davidsonii]|uniref:U-box domain-containing protein n=1 Tax=Penstemon davidsonii TaxID=160366 RepID=A0ABR0CNY5_9LAMI|nr:hypothetical protein RD792_014296 [Penstemon davidsonii]